jgi:flagellar biogenesis protein FliO
MARPIESPRASLPTVAAGTPAARVATILEGLRERHPVGFWAVASALGLAIVAALVLRPAGAPAAASSALDAFGSTAPAGSSGGALAGGSIDPVDLIVKGGLVVVLLFVTLNVMRRLGGGPAPADARIRVVETRTLAAKAQLHLVAIGDRQVLIGATPGRLVTLAEISGGMERQPEMRHGPSPAAARELPATIAQPLDDSFAAALLREAGLAAR